MRKEKRGLGVDRNGVQKMMRKRDYLADMSGQFGMNLVANLLASLLISIRIMWVWLLRALVL